jgi:putative hydrolase of the HAD superfamily
MRLPAALLLDLDDTILDDSSTVDECWRSACAANAHAFGDVAAATVVDAIRRLSKWYWSDPERHRIGRLELNAARREVVRLALLDLGLDDPDVAGAIGDAYSRHRDLGMEPLPDAIDTVRWLKESGRSLALLTNGAGPAQRAKIDRFGLANLFDAILVEGELGFGKPDPRVYQLALARLGRDPSEVWMVGDHLEWDVSAPQKLGVFSVWIDRAGRGVPPASNVRPDHVMRGLSGLRVLDPTPVDV